MITFLVAGRNDGYGVNLHKRTAISLNYFASLCRDEDDEIIYVDCNTPAHDLTLTEAIADTLTPEARRRIKTFRITGEEMQKAIGDTPLPFSDELSRNVGIRRSNPKNKWLLSTNCDILVQPVVSGGLHGVLRGLKPRFYVCPRVGIPIPQWQMLNRMDLAQIEIFCNEVIHQGFRMPPEKEQSWWRFGSIGDFQLAPREQWFQIGGCEEGMKFWGHSDANNSKRLSLLNGGGRTPDLGNDLCVLHLDHNPTIKASHEKIMVHNDWKSWVEDVSSPLSRNSDSWGLANQELTAISLAQRADLDPKNILKTYRRPRSFLSNLRTKTQLKLWRSLSSIVNRTKKS